MLRNIGYSSTLDHASTNAGTLRYMAPEVRNFQPYTAKADIWSLGVIALELVMTVLSPPLASAFHKD